MLSCALCFVLAVRGFKSAEGSAARRGPQRGWSTRPPALRSRRRCIWMFTKLLAINLPGLTATGWL